MSSYGRRLIRKNGLRLEREAARFAAEARVFSDRVVVGGPYSGDFVALIKSASRVMILAARLDGMNEMNNLWEEENGD